MRGTKLLVLQSLWAMERRHTDGIERLLEENVEMIAAAGFDGVSTHWTDRSLVECSSPQLNAHGMTAERQCFPKIVDDLKPLLEIATELPLHHLDIQPDVRPTGSRIAFRCSRAGCAWLKRSHGPTGSAPP